MLADATRVQVLWALVSREMSVNDLATHVGKPAPSVSQHLAKLRMARLVRTRREGTTIYYSLDNDHIGQLVTDAVFNAEHAGPGVPGHHRDAAELAALHPDTTIEPILSPIEVDAAHDPQPIRSRRPPANQAHRPRRAMTTDQVRIMNMVTGTTMAVGAASSARRCARCSPRIATMPPTASTGRWSPAPPASGR